MTSSIKFVVHRIASQYASHICLAAPLTILSLSPIIDKAVQDINQLLDSLPDALGSSRSLSERHGSGSPYLAAMRHYIQISARHKILVIYRALLAHGGTIDERRKAHAACIEVAQKIIEEVEYGQASGSGNMQNLWTIPYHGLAAAIVLALDLIAMRRDGFSDNETIEARKREVGRARQTLDKLAPTSRIARRGLKVSHDVTFDRGLRTSDNPHRSFPMSCVRP